MPNYFSVILQTRSFKIVGFEDLIVCFLLIFVRKNHVKNKKKERAEKKYPLSISIKKSVLPRQKVTKRGIMLDYRLRNVAFQKFLALVFVEKKIEKKF